MYIRYLCVCVGSGGGGRECLETLGESAVNTVQRSVDDVVVVAEVRWILLLRAS